MSSPPTSKIDLLLHAMRTFTQKFPTPRHLTDDELRRVTLPTLLALTHSNNGI